jgi:hypothetical protein
LPAHVQLLGGVVLFAYTSLGLVPFWEGFYQVDLMNGYVSQLVLHSHNPWTALGLGWHPWSICRGIGFCVITFEMCSISLGRLTGAPLSTCSRRRARWLAGLGFLLLDTALKYILLEPVRMVLAANLLWERTVMGIFDDIFAGLIGTYLALEPWEVAAVLRLIAGGIVGAGLGWCLEKAYQRLRRPPPPRWP